MALNDRGRDLTGAVVEGSGGSELVSAGPGGAAAGGGVSLVLDAGSAGGSLVVPGGAFLLVADYVREGPDLLLIGGDGRQVLIRDYFASETPPDLVSEGGARVSDDLAEALAGPAAPGQVAQAAPAAAAQPIGRVDTVEGEVVVARADGTQVSLSSGSPVFQGDVLETGSGASLGIVFVGDTTFSLGEDARMVLDELIYDPSTNTGSSAFSVIQGVFVFVSGEIAKSGDQAMVVTTPVGSIGIRGTTVAAEIAAEGEQSTITLLPDEDGSTGEIVFTNGGGTQFINIAYQQITATSFSVAPSAPEIKTAAEVEAQYGAALSALPAQAAAGAQDDGTAGEPGAADGEDGEGEGEDEGGEGEDGEVDPEALGELAPAAGEEGGDGEGEGGDNPFAGDDGAPLSGPGTDSGLLGDLTGGTGSDGLTGGGGGGGTTFITPTPDTSASTPTLDLDPDTAGNQLTGTTSGDEDSAIALDIDAALTDLDGSETLSVTITGIPDNATINLPSGGITFDPSGTDASPNMLLLANVTPGDLEGLSITPPPDFFGSFDLEITATAIEGASGATAPVTGTLTVNVADVAELPVEPPPEPEPEPSEFAIADATGSENPGAAIFTVTRTGDLSGTVSVDYQTNAVTATEGVDYTGAAGTLTFEPSVAELTIEVDVTADNLYEPVERFEITLSNPTGDATIADGEADGRILNNAHAPTGELHPGGLVNGFGFTISGIHENDESGTSVSGAGDVNNDGFADLLIGAPHGGVEEDGEGYIIFGGPDVGADGDIDLSSLDGTNGYVFIGDTEGDNAGTSVSGIGDVNDDGFDDFIIGAPHAQGSSLYDAGESYVIFGDHLSELDGNADGVIELSSLAAGDGSHGFVLNGLDNFDDSGHAVSGIGDVNGDGIDDFVIGAPYADRNEDDREGESYVVFGGSGSGIGSGGSLDLGGLDGDNGFRIIGDDRFDGSGRSVSGAGDVNGDGVDDLIIGAPYADPNGTGLGFGEEGESYVIFGKLSTESFAATIDLADITAGDGSDGFVLNGVQEGDQSGYAVSSAGDVNGDGFADLLIGAWEANRGFEGSDRGEAYVVFGSDDKDGRKMIGAGGSIELSDLDGSDGFKITGLNEFDYVGFSVSSAGDINGDDFDDILIGAPGEDRDANPNGFTYVLFGGEGGSFAASIDLATLDGSDGFRFAGREERDYAGTSVSGAGDVNGDGFNDLIIGAPEADPIVGNEGETFIIFGGPNVGGAGRPFMDTNLFDGSTGFTIDGIVEGDQSGYSVSGAGDVNGDGFTDLLIGAHRADPNGSQSGESYIVFGGSSLSVLDAADGATDSNIDLSNLDGTNGFVLNGIVAGDQSGRSVSGAGDVNGDGFDDFIIGAPRADEPNDAGESYVVFGGDSLSDLDGNADGVIELSSLAAGDGSDGFVIEGVVFSDRSGSAVSSAGDLNGYGFNDLIIGAPYAYGPPYSYSRPGESYVVFGGDDFAASLDLSEIRGGYGNDGFVLNGGDQSDRSGYAVGSAGDVNGDGFADFIIGAPKADPNGESEAGESYVVFGNHLSDLDAADGDTDGAIDLSSLADGGGTHGFGLNGISGLSEGDQSGRAVSGAGDVNGDGFADLIIGAPYVSETDEDRQQGEAYVVFGGAGVGTGGTIELDDIAEGDGSGGFVIEGVTEGYSEFGSSVSGAGDVNGDGFDDFLVGRPGDSSYAGYSATYVVFGGEDVGAGGSLDITTFTEADGFLVVNDFQDYDYTGKAVSGAGDVNGDGFDDLLVGAPRAGPAGGAGFNAEGESYVIFGGDFSGAVTHQGGTGADSLSGTGAGDVMVGGLGDDVLVGGGGEDVLRGGTGDDILGVGDLGFARIAGGAGEDVLRLDGAGLSLDLTAAGKGFEGNMKITGVEAIDLGGSGNALTLDLQDVLDMSDTSNTLKILGDEGDSLTADTETWTEQPAGAEGSEPGFTLYTNGLASLLIDDDVTQNVLSVGP